MNTKTRYFLVGSLLTLAIGLGVGFVAYSLGLSTTSAFALQGGPGELQFVPANASLVAFADVHDIMTSDLRQKVRSAFPKREDGQQEFQIQTGINIETDIDHVIAAIVPAGEQTGPLPGSAIVLARGRFDQVKIEALMREHGAQVEDYKGTRLIVGDVTDAKPQVSLAFLEPGLVAVGSSPLVRSAVDLKAGGSSIATNDEMMGLIRDMSAGNAWAAGHFDALTAQAKFPSGVAEQLPSVTLFSASALIDSGVRATLRTESRDDEAANSLRDVVRGFLALARLQTSSRPEISALLESLQLGGTGKTVSLSFDLPASAIEALVELSHPSTQTPQQQ
ncbi:MAG TPA: hypothetical protein VM032_10240 [Vicinamibacterales bacterium]|nr:hypothetical protein [Vicinamibacterales bacterium]